MNNVKVYLNNQGLRFKEMCANGAVSARNKFDRTIIATTRDQSELVNTIILLSGTILSCSILGSLPGCAILGGAMISAHRKDIGFTALPTLTKFWQFGCAALVCAVALAAFPPITSGITVGLIGGYALIQGLGCLWNYRYQIWFKDQCARDGSIFDVNCTVDEMHAQNYFPVN